MPSPLQGFDQIVAVTQNHINASLDTRFKLTPELGHLNAKGSWGKIDSVMSPATVYLYTPHEPFKARFCVNLSSGKCEWYRIDDTKSPPEVITEKADIKNWTLTFTVNLSLEAINHIPDDIKKKITFPGSYSLSQLLLDFTTADLSSKNILEDSSIKTPGVEGKDPERQVAFKHFMEVYLESLKKTGYNFLGYAITFQMMEHQDTNGKPDDPDLNCFLFLEMTSKDRKPPQMISWSKNWAGQSGTMVISKENFWDRFFVVRSKFLNRMALKMLNRLAYAYETADKWDAPWSIGPEPQDSALEWTSTEAQSMSYKWRYEVPVYDISQFYAWGRTCETTVNVAFDIGTNFITVKAWSHVWRKSRYSTPEGHGWKIEEHVINAEINWSHSLTLNSVADGTLDMSAMLDPPKATCWVENKSNLGNFWEPSNEELSRWAQADLQSRQDTNNNTLLTDVTQGLKTHSQFVFPGGGTFFMKNPQYNNDGDLMVDLQYTQNTI